MARTGRGYGCRRALTVPTTRAGAIAHASYLSESEAAAAGDAGHGLSLGTEQTENRNGQPADVTAVTARCTRLLTLGWTR